MLSKVTRFKTKITRLFRFDFRKEMNDNMITTDDINSKEAIKCVMFADGVKPGEGTSPVSSTADLQSPPLENNKRVLLKEKKRKYSKHKKSRKSKKKIKVKYLFLILNIKN